MSKGEPLDVWEKRINGEWLYTRTHRRHYITNGISYSDSPNHNLWEIDANVKRGFIHRPQQGYNLYHKGKFIKWGKTVKELKKYVDDYQKKK
jgi:hypothetical protein